MHFLRVKERKEALYLRSYGTSYENHDLRQADDSEGEP